MPLCRDENGSMIPRNTEFFRPEWNFCGMEYWVDSSNIEALDIGTPGMIQVGQQLAGGYAYGKGGSSIIVAIPHCYHSNLEKYELM